MRIKEDTCGIELRSTTLRSREGENLACDIRLPTLEAYHGHLAPVIFLHGFRASKDWGPFPYVCCKLAASGLYVVSVNFSHNGTGADDAALIHPDRFRVNTISREISEAHAVIDALSARSVPAAERIGLTKTAILGHSRGAGIALIAAADRTDVGRLGLWSPISTFDRNTTQQRAQWRSQGYLETADAASGRTLLVDVSYLTDLESNKSSFDLCAAARRFGRPLLIVHGEADIVVRPKEGARLAQCAGSPSAQFVSIPGAGHTFGGYHPFEESNARLDEAITCTAGFFSPQHLHSV